MNDSFWCEREKNFSMTKKKAIIIPVVFIAVTLLVVFAGFSGLNIFSYFDLGEILGVHSNVDGNIRTNDELIEELKGIYLASSDKKQLSADMNAIWLDINEDLLVSAEDGTEAVKYCIYSDVNFYKNFVPDTYFIKPDTENEFSSLLEPDGTRYDILAYILYYVKDVDCDAVLVADDSLIFDESGKLTTEKLEHYLKNYRFDGVLISCDSLYSQNVYAECAQTLSDFVRSEFPELPLGIEVHSDFEKLFADDYVTKVFQEKLVDFGYVDIGSTTGDENYPFQSVALWWNYFSDYYKIPLYCEYRLDSIFSSEGDWSYASEISDQMKALHYAANFEGGCFYNSSQLKNKKSLARDLSIYINDVAGTNDDGFEVNSLIITDRTVSFTGTVADNNGVFCNKDLIHAENGVFNYSSLLLSGNNDFVFFSNGAYYTYSVYDNSSMFADYSSGDSVKLDAEMYVNVFAECPDGSNVFAIVNGAYYQLTVDNSEESSAKGFTIYSASIPFFAKEIVSDELQLVCFCGNLYEAVSCGSIRFELNSTGSVGIQNAGSDISPFSDNGLGTSLMCITKYDNTELISDRNDYDTYHPYNSSLVKGTIDYVKQINVSAEGYLRYELNSGLTVYGTDATLIKNGYNLPLNSVTLVDRYIDSKLSSFSFDMQWLSPVTVTVKNLDYYKGYQEFAFNIDKFDAEYIDINFYYSDKFGLSQQMLLENDPLFSSYELYTDASGTMLTLRLFLKTPGRFYGYDIVTEDNGSVKIVFRNYENNSVAGKVIMLDAGHGGISMVGTALNDNSVSESQITLGIAQAAKKYLEAMGATVLMTRVMDTSLTLSERTYMCETQNPDIFVSVHCDGADDSTESGTHTFYYTPFSMNLASEIHSGIVDAYTSRIYLPADDNFERIDRKIKYYPFYVTRVDNCPSVLIETGFLTNYVEGNVLANPSNQEIIGNAIAAGISKYFSKY